MSNHAFEIHPVTVRAWDSEQEQARLAVYDPGTLWRGLLRAEFRVRSTFTSPKDVWALIDPQPAPGPMRHDARIPDLVSGVMLGESQKALSIQYGFTEPVLAAILKRFLTRIGLECRMGRVPLALPLLAHAAAGSERAAGCFSAVTLPSGRVLVHFARVEEALKRNLTPAEWEVALHLIEGKSSSEMGRLRKTKPRTIANQRSSLFRKLRATGRFELICFMLKSSEPPVRPPESLPNRAEPTGCSRMLRAG